ncbi:uncharacterized protein N7459_005567 [Penicillium hispanicum]|uniref:uncharacterized protein n=1 Tax=Penicillium hispanicum TaxID=1080232 RepID=UPI0025413A2F|nr:uncharacterized protein N7459_005567 [Penicillium hispanicum]KAJ5579582.1 hypothetical protein N7459_005567 [Penicillium hispanicum]
MKLIVAGATGLVGSEIIRQSLQVREITQVIALARKSVQIGDNLDSSKLKSVVVRDYGEYSDDAKAELAGADACIWTVAVTPFRTSSFDFAEVKRVCQDCTLAGFKAIYEAGPARPFRFLYFSAEGTPQDPTKKPALMGDYQIMRCETENMVRQLPVEYEGVEVCIAHPGVVTNSTTWSRAALHFLFKMINAITQAIPNVDRGELSAAVLNQAVAGFKKSLLSNADLVRLGKEVLRASNSVRRD